MVSVSMTPQKMTYVLQNNYCNLPNLVKILELRQLSERRKEAFASVQEWVIHQDIQSHSNIILTSQNVINKVSVWDVGP